jgi:hypothetical protein
MRAPRYQSAVRERERGRRLSVLSDMRSPTEYRAEQLTLSPSRRAEKRGALQNVVSGCARTTAWIGRAHDHVR